MFPTCSTYFRLPLNPHVYMSKSLAARVVLVTLLF